MNAKEPQAGLRVALTKLDSYSRWTRVHDELLADVRELSTDTDLAQPASHLCQAIEHSLLAAKSLGSLGPTANEHLKSGLQCLLNEIEQDDFANPRPRLAPETIEPLTLDSSTVRNQLVTALNHHAIVSITDSCGNIVYANDKFLGITGYQLDELLGENHRLIKSDIHPPAFYKQLWDTITSGRVWRGEQCNRRKDGSNYWVAAAIYPVLDEQGRPERYISIRTDITQVKELEIEAWGASRAKSEFLSSMSHELRTPMNAILGFAQILEYDETLDDDQQDSVHEIARAGAHLLELINEVLDLAKIESGKVEMSIEPVSIPDLIAECEDLLAPLAVNKEVDLNLTVPGSPVVKADRLRLKQVLLNLLSNAIKYNHRKGSVRLRVEENQAGDLRLFIIDTGPGIPSSKQHLLFQPFNRLGADSSDIEGTGIGLSIARTLVELMDGQVGMDSEEGQGSCFWIELPKVPGTNSGEAENAAALQQERHGLPQPDQHLVLYIEDNPANIRLVSQIMAKRPHVRLLTAHEPELGLELAAAHVPELILLDINMPRLNGYQVLERLRADQALRNIPVVALTASAMPQDIARGEQAGFDDYLTKPLNITRLLALVDELK
ncbi:hybrid sensor histidine kinase/response regulator [Marinobacterium rhizophilum]|uniref:ATP-binding response regulator n=1 Tax=Marinobacterium rhizophilum TaxID=420402 RepID=UPI0003A843C6|nr:PAS domain-containing hybrid sensor histidine kinase/response regulator [Marinobacterium rhizophilum]